MRRGPPQAEHLIALLLLGLVLFNYPLLAVLGGAPASGVPTLWIGLFALWAVFIALIWLAHRGPRDD